MTSWISKLCPKCGKRTVNTKESRARVNWRYRRKLCLNCGAKGSTLEIPIEDGVKPMLERVRFEGGFQTMIQGVPLAIMMEQKRRRAS